MPLGVMPWLGGNRPESAGLGTGGVACRDPAMAPAGTPQPCSAVTSRPLYFTEPHLSIRNRGVRSREARPQLATHVPVQARGELPPMPTRERPGWGSSPPWAPLPAGGSWAGPPPAHSCGPSSAAPSCLARPHLSPLTDLRGCWPLDHLTSKVWKPRQRRLRFG